jgi:hypothetical protein
VITVRDRIEDLTASFTDDTSPNLPTLHRKVSIHRQVIKESDDLEWFRELIKLYPNDSPETKSVRILQRQILRLSSIEQTLTSIVRVFHSTDFPLPCSIRRDCLIVME